jgi:Replication factor-A protein 1, N-terminal domain
MMRGLEHTVRYRLKLTDGVHEIIGMMGATFKDMVDGGRLPMYSLIRLKDYLCNDIGGQV